MNRIAIAISLAAWRGVGAQGFAATFWADFTQKRDRALAGGAR